VIEPRASGHAHARRYAATVEDAEDAYQRGIEIILTKAPEIPEAELLPWLKTVVRHEAFALRRKDERIALGARGGVDGDADGEDAFVSLAPTPGEQAERFERLRLGAEALNGLKPQEARALALLAEGYSYRQIAELSKAVGCHRRVPSRGNALRTCR
jgi:RNA polymerase sigma factor (sigma-70 family)